MMEAFTEIPDAIRMNANKQLIDKDVVHLTEAFKEIVWEDWQTVGSLYFNLSLGSLANIEECSGRELKIYRMMQLWIEQAQQGATFSKLHSILDKAKLIGTKQVFWNYYRDEEAQKVLKAKQDDLKDFFSKLVQRPITENEWTKVLINLGVQEKAQSIQEMQKHYKIRQRLNILHYWVGKLGYGEATIDKLKEGLKKAHLRRVICEIAGPEGNPSQMNEKFIHFLEDNWDHIFATLSTDEQGRVLSSLTSGNSVNNSDDAFNQVMKGGNAGFHKFIKTLRQECPQTFPGLIEDEQYNKMFNIRKVYPKAPHFKHTEAYREMEDNIKKERFLLLHGLPGSGKSQCVSAFAEQFIKDHPLSVVWFVDCKNVQCSDDSLLSLRNELRGAGIYKNNRSKDYAMKGLVEDIRSSDLYVLLILEDVYSKVKQESQIFKLLQELKHYNKGYVIATTRSSSVAHEGMFKGQQVKGFTEKEALNFLLNGGSESYSEEEKLAAKEMAGRYSNLPLGIAPAKAYCDEKHLSFVDYLQAMDEEVDALQIIQEYQNEWINEFYKTDEDGLLGKNILATMMLALSSLKQQTISNRTINFLDVFSYAMFFHHDKIPIYLFQQLILQPDISSGEHTQISDIHCKVALGNMVDELKNSSLGVVDYKGRNVTNGTISTHRVVIFALKCMAQRNNQIHNPNKLLNALYALACYFQKDNRLSLQHTQLMALMPHVESALSKVHTRISDTPTMTREKMLETMLVIRLLELKGFACTQIDAVSDAEEPLNEAHDLIMKFLCSVGGIELKNLNSTVKERVLEGNGPDSFIETKARLLNQFCKRVANTIVNPKTFDLLVQTVILNEEDIDLLKRNCTSDINWKKDIKVNNPITENALQILRQKRLALSEQELKSTYLAEQLASILYTRGRLMFYDGVNASKEQCIDDLKLSYYVTKEVFRDTGKRLLHLLLTKTNALLYLQLDPERGTNAEKVQNFEDAYGKYRDYLNENQLYYEHGVLKEDGKTNYNTIRCYKQMIKANHETMKVTGEKKTERFQVCLDLKRLVHDNQQYAKTAVTALLVAGDFCIFGENYPLAIDIYREVMDRVKDNEEANQRAFFKATEGFSNAAIKLHRTGEFTDSRQSCREAWQRCEKAVVLVPRADRPESTDKVKSLQSELDLILNENDPKKRKTTN